MRAWHAAVVIAELWAVELAAEGTIPCALPVSADGWKRGPIHTCRESHLHGRFWADGDDCLRCDAIRLAFEIAETGQYCQRSSRGGKIKP